MFCHSSLVHEGTAVIPVSHPEGCVKTVVRTNSSPVPVVLGVGAAVVGGVELDAAEVELDAVEVEVTVETEAVDKVDIDELGAVSPEARTPIELSRPEASGQNPRASNASRDSKCISFDSPALINRECNKTAASKKVRKSNKCRALQIRPHLIMAVAFRSYSLPTMLM
jgi:hypothetical protein